MTIAELLTIISLLGGAIGIWLTIHHFKIVRTISYIERMNDPSMVEIRASVDEWLSRPITDEQKILELQQDHTLKAKYNIFYNLLTELAISFNNGLLNRELVLKTWNPLVPYYWERINCVIIHERNLKYQVGEELEKFNAEFEHFSKPEVLK